MAHAASTAHSPLAQASIGMLDVFVTTLVICSMTGFAILVTGEWCSGIGGGIYYLAGTGQFVIEKSILGMGFNGIPVALLASSNPIGTIFSALFISYIQVGGAAMQPAYSSETIDIVIAVIIYLAAFALLMRGLIAKAVSGHKEKGGAAK